MPRPVGDRLWSFWHDQLPLPVLSLYIDTLLYIFVCSYCPYAPVGDRLWSFWHDQLQLPLPVLSLPIDNTRPPMASGLACSYSLRLTSDLSRQLRRVAEREGATMYEEGGVVL